MSPGQWLSMRYRDFYDLPRLVAVEHGGHFYLFDAPFDDDSDEYTSHYVVYRLPEEVAARLDDPSWSTLPSLGEEVGRVPVAALEFDPTRRERLCDSVFRKLDLE